MTKRRLISVSKRFIGRRMGINLYHFEPKDRRGSGHKYPKKLVVDAILYVVKGGIPWRLMPTDFPCWKTVYDHFRKWNRQGVWETALDQLNQIHRKKKRPHGNPELRHHRLTKR